MEINTKYNIGDAVWTISDHKAVRGKVTGIVATVGLRKHENTYGASARYSVDLGWGEPDIKEENLYPTREELIADL